MNNCPESIGLFFSPDAYVEPAVGGRLLMGRHVAGAELLDGYLHHGGARRIVPIVSDRPSIDAFDRIWNSHPGVKARGRTRQFVGSSQFHRQFGQSPPTRLMFLPGPLDAQYAWSRQAGGGHEFAICGMTYTICTPSPVQSFAQMLTAPYQPYDALICSSESVRNAIIAMTDSYAGLLREMHGGNPRLRVRLEVIPYGVNVHKYRPATPDERAARRKALGIGDDEIAVLFVGRLSFHAKANPYPVFHGLYHAARLSGKKVRLLLSGTAANEHIHRAFLEGAKVYAPTVNTMHVDSMNAEMRTGIWHAGDIFTTLVDNYQESLGLTILQAMACGLPVVGSDWDGYKDTIVNGETGFLVPTCIVPGAATNLPSRLLMREINDDVFLASTSQTVVVDCDAATRVFTELFKNLHLCRKLGEAGRQRVVDHFSFEKIIPRFDRLWSEQEAERVAVAARSGPVTSIGPAIYPVPEVTFAGYATRVASDADLVQSCPDCETLLLRLMKVAISSYSPETRCTDAQVLRSVLVAAAKPISLRDLDSRFRQQGIDKQTGRSTLAWMLKYHLMRFVSGNS
jgi:glycosyltransferase involved in cell wall biosynthesis